MSAMMDEKERASALERLAPKPTAQEMEAVNGLFRHFLFKRCGKSEIWTTCCRRHTFVKPDTDNADELRVLHAPHTPEPRSGWHHSPTVKRCFTFSRPKSCFTYSCRRGPSFILLFAKSLEMKSSTSHLNPSTPRSAQKSTISQHSCLTFGFSQFRSGCCVANECR